MLVEHVTEPGTWEIWLCYVLEVGAAGDLDPRAVEHPRGLRAERPVHEGLDVADSEERVTEARRDADLGQPVDVVVRERLPHPKREGAFSLELLEDGERTEPAVFVVDRDDAAGVGEPDSLTRGVHHLSVGRTHVDVAEMPGAFLPQDTGRLALVVALDDPAGNLGCRRPGEGRRVQPERVETERLFFRKALLITIHEISTHCPVNMNIDESR